MPSRNVVKIDIPQTFYHVYARGHARSSIYRDNEDYRVFLNLFKRYLNTEAETDNVGRQYAHLRGNVELVCYCLMPNHFHLLLYQVEEHAMKQLMHGIMTSYSRYFNKKYGLSGALFETTYKASMILSDNYLLHITRYIHLNPKKWRTYDYSSLPYYLGRRAPYWLQTERVVELFTSRQHYNDFVEDHEGYKAALDEVKSNLAGE